MQRTEEEAETVLHWCEEHGLIKRMGGMSGLTPLGTDVALMLIGCLPTERLQEIVSTHQLYFGEQSGRSH